MKHEYSFPGSAALAGNALLPRAPPLRLALPMVFERLDICEPISQRIQARLFVCLEKALDSI